MNFIQGIINGLFDRIDAIADGIARLIVMAFKVLWNVLLTALIGGAFFLWFAFLFGSVAAVVIVLIFKPELFLLPMVLDRWYVKI